jgi:hypothetical protein
MKLFPASLAIRWHQVAARALAGRPAQPADVDGWTVARRIGGWMLFAGIASLVVCHLMGIFSPHEHQPQRQQFTAGVLLMCMQALVFASLLRPFSETNTDRVLRMLPASGADLVRRSHRLTLLGSLWVLAFALLISVLLQIGSGRGSGALHLVAQGGLMWGMVLSGAAIGAWRRWPVVGPGFVLFALAWLVLAAQHPWLHTMLQLHDCGADPRGLAATAFDRASWLLPPTWVIWGRLESGGWMLTLPWLLLGAWCWWRRVRTTGALLDGPGDLVALGPDEQDEVGDTQPLPCEAGEDELDVWSQGWVERWVSVFIPGKNQSMLAALLPARPGWSRLWLRALVDGMGCLAAIWILRRVFPDGAVSDLSLFFLLVLMGSRLWTVFPATNQVPRASEAWAVGGQQQAVVALLPLCERQLLNLSMRLTLARGLVWLVLAAPMSALLVWILGLSAIGFALLAPLVLWLLWLGSRPLFWYYRLQTVSTPRFEGRRGHYGTLCLILLMGWAWAMSSLFALLGISRWLKPVAGEISPMLWFITPVCILISAGLARLAFELWHRRVRAGQVDWLGSGSVLTPAVSNVRGKPG